MIIFLNERDFAAHDKSHHVYNWEGVDITVQLPEKMNGVSRRGKGGGRWGGERERTRRTKGKWGGREQDGKNWGGGEEGKEEWERGREEGCEVENGKGG